MPNAVASSSGDGGSGILPPRSNNYSDGPQKLPGVFALYSQGPLLGRFTKEMQLSLLPLLLERAEGGELQWGDPALALHLLAVRDRIHFCPLALLEQPEAKLGLFALERAAARPQAAAGHRPNIAVDSQ